MVQMIKGDGAMTVSGGGGAIVTGGRPIVSQPTGTVSNPNSPANPVGGNAPTPTVPGGNSSGGALNQILGEDDNLFSNRRRRDAFGVNEYVIPGGSSPGVDLGLLFSSVKKSNWFADILDLLEQGAKKVADLVTPDVPKRDQ